MLDIKNTSRNSRWEAIHWYDYIYVSKLQRKIKAIFIHIYFGSQRANPKTPSRMSITVMTTRKIPNFLPLPQNAQTLSVNITGGFVMRKVRITNSI